MPPFQSINIKYKIYFYTLKEIKFINSETLFIFNIIKLKLLIVKFTVIFT